MPPSDQCTDEIEAIATGADPGRSIAAQQRLRPIAVFRPAHRFDS